MPINIGGASIEAVNTPASNLSRFNILNTSGTTVFSQGFQTAHGFLETSNRPGFIAMSNTDPGWLNWATNGWGKTNSYCATMLYNKGSHYNPANQRFTAPINGPYLFVWTIYTYINDYAHPMFAVNGDVTLRRTYTPYKIRSHGMVANYQQDHQIQETINLVAGDYVETYAYASGTGYVYPRYGVFAGVYVG